MCSEPGFGASVSGSRTTTGAGAAATRPNSTAAGTSPALSLLALVMLRFDCSIKLRVAQRRVACRMQDLPRGGNKREPAYDTCSLIGQTGPATNSGIRCMRQQRSLSDDQVDVFTQSSSIECFS